MTTKSDFSHIFEGKAHLAGSPAGLCYNEDFDMEPKFRKVASMISRYMGTLPPRILDVGCGYANLLQVYTRFDTYTGVEPTEWIYKEAQKRVISIFGESYCGHGVRLYNGLLQEVDLDLCSDYEVVMALGIITMLDEPTAATLLKDLAAKTSRYLILAYQAEELGGYEGRLNRYCFKFVEEHTGMTIEEVQTLEGNTEILVVLSK